MAKERNRRIVRTSAILVTLLLTALLCARGTTQIVASKVLPLAEDEPDSARRPTSLATGQGPEPIRQIAEAVLTRNIFDSQTGSMSWDVPLAQQTDGGDGPTSPVIDTPTDGEPAFCPAGMRLIASMVVPQVPELSFANIEAQGKALLYRQGMQVDGHEIVGIREHRVFLRPSGRPMCQLAMFAPQAPAAPPAVAAAPAPAEPAAGEPKKTGGLAEEELNQGITQVSDTNYTVSRSLLDKVLQNQSELMRAARVIPYEENGRTIGVKVYGIRRTSILGKLGIQNGDVLRTINGFDLSSPDSALEAYTKLRTMDQFSIAMVRRGQPRTMEYSVK